MAAATTKANTITRLRAAIDLIIYAQNQAADVMSEIAALGTVDQIADTGDPLFEDGAHQGMTKADVINAVFAASQFGAFYETHKTNLHNARN